MAGPGLTFAPMDGDAAEQRATSSQLSPAQRAVQVLSLRLPRVLGARRISPRELMGAAGGGAAAEVARVPGVSGPGVDALSGVVGAEAAASGGWSPESALLQTIAKAGIGSGRSGLPGASSPPPVITPGVDQPPPEVVVDKVDILPPPPPTDVANGSLSDSLSQLGIPQKRRGPWSALDQGVKSS